jgi:acyl dehydratase
VTVVGPERLRSRTNILETQSLADSFHPRAVTPIDGFDDLAVGQTFELGEVVIARDAILDFAAKYDPQPFHLDEEAAAASIFGGLAASGLHSIAAIFGLSVRAGLLGTANLAGSAMDEVRWLRPVRPGDRLALRWTIVSLSPSRSRPDRGSARIRSDVTNQAGEAVLSLTLTHVLRR